MYLWKFHTWREKSRVITVYLFAFKKSLLPWPRGAQQFPTGKKKNGPCFPKRGWWTKGSWMGQRGTLSLKHFIDHIAHPLIFNALYIWVRRGFVFVNLLVQHHSVKTLGMKRPNARCSMQWLWAGCFFSHFQFECHHLGLLRGKEQVYYFKGSEVMLRKSHQHFSVKLPRGPWLDIIRGGYGEFLSWKGKVALPKVKSGRWKLGLLRVYNLLALWSWLSTTVNVYGALTVGRIPF